MTLADELAAAPAKEVSPCPFGKAMAAFPDDAAAMLKLAQHGDGAVRRRKHLRATLKKHGYSFSNSTIDRHLAGDCGCPR